MIRQHCHCLCLCLCPFWSQVNLTKQQWITLSFYFHFRIWREYENLQFYECISTIVLFVCFFFPLTCLFLFWSLCDKLCTQRLTNLSISLCPMQEKIDVILTTACHLSPLNKQWTKDLHIWTPHISAASTLHSRWPSVRGVDDTATSGQGNVCVHTSSDVWLCLRVFGLK